MTAPTILYFAHDVGDAAVARRVRQMQAGGAHVQLVGFRRAASPLGEVAGLVPFDLGRTFDGRLGQRAALLARHLLTTQRWRLGTAAVKVVLARNLEMVLLARAFCRAARMQQVPVVYECLDIHRMVLGDRVPHRLLRAIDRGATRRASALLISSPEFKTQYFDRLGITLPPVILAENKRLLRDGETRPEARQAAEPPWRIGWFGRLRCERSFVLLYTLAQRLPERVEVVLRGQASPAVASLIATLLPLPNMRFAGTYQADELGTIYQPCHFTWAVDWFDPGLNSEWLLPNRVYEGGFYNVPPIARAGTATASWLRRRNTGVILENEPLTAMMQLLSDLTAASYQILQASAEAVPLVDLAWTTEECRALTAQVLRTANHSNDPVEVKDCLQALTKDNPLQRLPY